MSKEIVINNLLRNKRILFATFAFLGGILSGIVVNVFPFIMNNSFLSWVIPGALDAALIGAMTVYAQNYYQTKCFKINDGLKGAFKKGLMVGAIGGFAAYVVVQLLGAGNMSRSIGWAISGGVAGFVVSNQVPNLKMKTAIIAGAIGGFVGCIFMLMDFGYTLGVGITGGAIGLMVAMAEIIFRKNWLDIEVYPEVLGAGLTMSKPVRSFTVTLGPEAITIGSGEAMNIKTTLYHPTHDHSASIYVDNNNVYLHDLVNKSKTELKAGNAFKFGECKLTLGA